MDKNFYKHSHYVCIEALQAIDDFTDDEKARYGLKSVYLGLCRGRQGVSPETDWGAKAIANQFIDERTPEMRRKIRGRTIKKLCQVRYEDDTPLILPMKDYNKLYGTQYREQYTRGDKYAVMDYKNGTLFAMPHELYNWHDDGKRYSFITRVTEHTHRCEALDVLIGIYQSLNPVNCWGLDINCMDSTPEPSFEDGNWLTYHDDLDIDINPEWAGSVAGSVDRFMLGYHVLKEAGTVYTAMIAYSDKPEYFCTVNAKYWREHLPLMRSHLASNYEGANELFGSPEQWQLTYGAPLKLVLRPRVFPMTKAYYQMLDDIDKRTEAWSQEIAGAWDCY